MTAPGFAIYSGIALDYIGWSFSHPIFFSCKDTLLMNSSGMLPTKCAPAERLDKAKISGEYAALAEHYCASFFDFFPLPLLVLNQYRQVVLCNKSFFAELGADDINSFLGLRPGEALNCVYSKKEEGGCGTSKYCKECGALRAILSSVRTHKSTVDECHLLAYTNDGTTARDLKIFVSPWDMSGEEYYVVTLLDIEDETRRRALERIFFHDILNSAGGAKGIIDLLYDSCEDDNKEILGVARSALFGMVDEILKQRELLAVESGEFQASPVTLQGLEIIQGLTEEYANYPVAMEKILEVAPDCRNVSVRADYALLRRVLGNMLKNALEASDDGETVRIGLRQSGEHAEFWVHNPAVMPESVQLQVFKRSFSTKGKGRGLGTYSIKTLTENYLSGKVGFTSQEGAGTTFWMQLPQYVADSEE